MDVKNYIQKNWENTIRTSEQADNSFMKLPKPYTVPCAKTLFTNFFYWDTYFAIIANVKTVFDARGVQMSYPHTVVHLEK